MWIVYFVIYLLYAEHVNGYFDDQPKFISENGHLILESALDRNISFRLRGKGSLNINDVNVMKMFQNGTDVTDAVNINLRLNQMDTTIANMRRRFGGNRGIMQRLNRLENRTRGGGSNNQNIIWRITTLELRIDEIVVKLIQDNCESDPCQNGGTCMDLYDNFICKCPENWTGTTCTQDVNECAIFAGTDLGCQNGASCSNTPGSYNCLCTPGWHGIHCARRSVDCLASGSLELCSHGTCVPSADLSGYRCLCDQGWKTNSLTPACTVDVDECADAKPHCSTDPMVTCLNLPGSYMCGPCPHGYTGNGHYCSDINECDVNNGGCSIAPLVNCINTRGSHYCGNCPIGYIGDGRICTVSAAIRPDGGITTNLCSTSICHSLAQCIEGAFRPICICPAGYTGNGMGPSGCTRIVHDLCSSNPCQNGGTCAVNSLGTQFSCSCPPGTVRPLCAISTNPCTFNLCQNGGICTPISDSTRYRCVCPPKYTGLLCQTEVRACGGVLMELSGTLKYPPANNYPHNSRCAWLIKTNVTQVLNITFTRFNVEQSQDCHFDWLQIHDGRSSASHMIGRFCGNTLPKGGNIISTHNMLYFWFRSDNTTSHDGFELQWNSINPVCGGELDITTFGTISSPGSPGNYPPNRDCTWVLMAPIGKRIQFHFFTMQLEAHETCDYDYLAIYSGLNEESPLMSKFCNTSHVEPLTTPSNEATLFFHSDEDSTDAGFQIHYSVVEGMPGCGGTFTAMNGEFGPPIQDGVYLKNQLCHYLIRLPKDNRISITFTKFNLEESNTCIFDYIEVYEGTTENDQLVGRWCGSETPPTYQSLGNALLIVFKSDWSAQHEGFNIVYDTVCGGVFTTETGEFTSPLYPNNYDDSRTCEYLIEAPLGKSILLDFIDFDIEETSYPLCDFDWVAIHDGINANSTQLGKYCGTNTPPRAVSNFNFMFVTFTSDSSMGGRGFKANYSFTDMGCGGIYRTNGQVISPPMSNSGYQHNAKCTWIIVAPVGHVIQLTFSSFHLEISTGCYFDAVTIYDGYVNETIGSDPTKPVGNFCGHNIPSTILSTNNILSIVFRSDDSASGDGFMATYNFVDGKRICGGRFILPTGTIRSPGYPDNYPLNKDCTYIISADNGKQVELLVKHFELEYQSSCTFDSLEIRNGGSENSPIMGTYCGTDIPPRIQSFSNQIYVRFRSDSSTSLKGFEIDWDATSTGCGGVFVNAPRGSITSPNYPEPYGEYAQCDWRISMSHGSFISMIITDLELEEQVDCSFDSLEIFDGPDSSAPTLGKFCNKNHPLHITTTSNQAFIRFKSDVSNQGRGFDIRFTTDCRRTITEKRGAIESPNFPLTYGNNLDCEWKIKPPPGNTIFIDFSHFDLEFMTGDDNQEMCAFDALTIEELDESDIVVHSTKSCNTAPKAFETSKTLVIKFHTDASTGGKGFHLEYEIRGCGAELTKPSDRFTSPNYPNPYPHDIHCEWSITTEIGHLIELTLDDFDFEATPNCIQDGLIISNDKNQTSVINKLCSSKNEMVHTFTSHSNKMFLSFFSDFSYSGKGFSATYKTISSKCGGIFTSPTGTIQSPNYPNNFDRNIYCEWLLKTEPTHTMTLRFNDFDLIRDANCSSSSVRVYSGSEKIQSKQLLFICGSEIENSLSTPVVSLNNEMLVILESNAQYSSKGFSASFSTSCGSKIIANDSGIIEVGHNIRWVTDDCTWTIIAANPGQHITLHFLHLDNDPVFQRYMAQYTNETVNDCLRTIYVHDGDSKSAPVQHEICTNRHPPAIVSNGNALTISLSNVSFNDAAFAFDMKASYSVLDNACGGIYNSKNGQIASPLYPKSYPNNVECEWTIQASEGNLMSITIEMMDIFSSPDCNNDYLELRENDGSGKVLGLFCGREAPSALITARKIWMKFRSDSDGTGPGFLLSYSYARLVEHSGPTGVITSVLYPNYVYVFEGKYTYRITVDAGLVIQIAFDNCILKRDSKIIIYDGYDESNSPELLTQKQDDVSMSSVVSTSNVVFITFSISSFSESKFKLVWNQMGYMNSSANVSFVDNLNCTENSIVNLAPRQIQMITSPGFPNGYDVLVDCKWTFVPTVQGYHALLTFNGLDLESTDGCIADYVSVSKSRDLDHFTEIAKVCTPDPDRSVTMYRGTPSLRVEFRSDSYLNKTGFSATVELDCGGLLTQPSGIIEADMVSLTTGRFTQTCTWDIAVKRGRTIQFEFNNKLTMKRHPDGSCASYIIIRNGDNDEAPFLGDGKFCENKAFTIPKTSGNKAYVKYVKELTPVSFEDVFEITYRQVEHNCGGEITLTSNNNSTIINTPNYPNIPLPFIECIWRIAAPNGELIIIEFLERFDLTSSRNCTQEYVEIRDGSTMAASTIGRFCDAIPPTQMTTSNMARVHYFTDVLVPKNGFKAKLSIAKCGGSYNSWRGFVTSKNYPGSGSYPSQSVCDYRITGRTHAMLNLTFSDVHLPSSENCSETDHITIYSIQRRSGLANMMENANEIAVICGTDIPLPILSDSNEVLIRFTSKQPNSQYRGFRLFYNSTNERCGGEIEAETGIITSPGYPIGGTMQRFCEWLITVPKGRRVRVDLIDYDIRSNVVFIPRFSRVTYARRVSSRIGFYHNRFVLVPIRAYMRSNIGTPDPIYSTDNKMFISLFLSDNIGHRGLKLNFSSNEISPCAGNMNGDSGNFATPINLTSYYCEYYRTDGTPLIANAPSTGTIGIRLSDQTEYDQGCENNDHYMLNVVISFVKTGNDQILYRTCNRNRTDQYFSTPFADTKIIAKQVPNSGGDRRYQFQYKVHNCGGVFRITEPMNITNPSYSPGYGALDCAWQFKSDDQQIQVLISSGQFNCDNEYIQIYNGDSPVSPKVSKICGNNNSNRLFTLMPNMFIEYHTDDFKPSSNFNIQISTQDGMCGGEMQSPHYYFSSPRNGTNYPNNVECVWNLIARTGFHIGLKFVNRFFLESSLNCTKDYVAVYDKQVDNWVQIGKFCGRDTPAIVNSTGREMRIVLHTDDSTVGDGFSASWAENCGGTFKATNDISIIESPGYPLRYFSNLFCNYTILANPGEQINLNFVDFELEAVSASCAYDNITIYRIPPYYSSPEMEGPYCRSGSISRLRYATKIVVVFQTDKWIAKRGFKLEYNLDRCGGNINQSTIIESPTDNNNEYLLDSKCIWNITAPLNQKIVVRFEMIDLEHNDACYMDYVEVYQDHNTEPSNRKAKLCGKLQHPLPSINILSNKAIVKFRTDSSVSAKGFRALILFMASCDEYIHLNTSNPSHTLLRSNSEYEDLLDCHYEFIAPSGYVIKMSVQWFHLAMCTNNSTVCTCDFLEVRDGAGPFSELIGTYCGHQNPPDFTSHSNSLWIRFATDATIRSSGYRINLEMEETTCGPREYIISSEHSVVELSFPAHGGLYSPNLNCEWLITGPDSDIIDIRFEKFDIQESDDQGLCALDYLEITDEDLRHYIAEGLGEEVIFAGERYKQKQPSFYQGKQWAVAPHRYCGSQKPVDYFSTGKSIYIKFKSDASIQKSGFKLLAKKANVCDRTYNSTQGRLISKESLSCEAYIYAPANHTISLYFTAFNYYLSEMGCADENTPIEVFDAHTNTRIQRICSATKPDPVFTNTNAIKLKFRQIAVSWVDSNGLYDITYLASDKGSGCGGELFNFAGSFSSPGYPNNDRNSSDCRWVVSVPNNLRLAMQFEVFDMGSRSGCEENYVEITDLCPSEPGLARKYCGTDNPANYVANCNKAVVHMKKNSNFGGSGWYINFIAIGLNANSEILW